jgi:hypothetical protein
MREASSVYETSTQTKKLKKKEGLRGLEESRGTKDLKAEVEFEERLDS